MSEETNLSVEGGWGHWQLNCARQSAYDNPQTQTMK